MEKKQKNPNVTHNCQLLIYPSCMLAWRTKVGTCSFRFTVDSFVDIFNSSRVGHCGNGVRFERLSSGLANENPRIRKGAEKDVSI